VLYEVGPICYLIEKGGGKTITNGNISVMDFIIKGYDDRI
jgi:fructose-1,6-bisphosphatase